MKRYFRELIKEIRGEESLREFSQKCGISHTIVNMLEKGISLKTGKKINPTIEVLEKISRGTDTPLFTLLISLCDDIDKETFDLLEMFYKQPKETQKKLIKTLATKEKL